MLLSVRSVGRTAVRWLATDRSGVKHDSVRGLASDDKRVFEVANERAGSMKRQTDQRRLLLLKLLPPSVRALAIKTHSCG